MIDVTVSACINAPADRVWAALARIEDLKLWSEAVLDSRCDGAISRGVGAERTCDLRGRVTIRERWIAWDEGESFTYEGSGLPFVERATNTWIVTPIDTQSILTTRARVSLRGGRLGRLLEPVVRYQSVKLGSRSLAAFQYLVEQGKPPDGRHSRLPKVSATC